MWNDSPPVPLRSISPRQALSPSMSTNTDADRPHEHSDFVSTIMAMMTSTFEQTATEPVKQQIHDAYVKVEPKVPEKARCTSLPIADYMMGPYYQDDQIHEFSRRPLSTSMQKSLHRASKRISLTPSDIQAAGLAGSLQRAETILGMREHDQDPSSIEMQGKRDTSPSEARNGRMAWLQASLAILVVFNCWGFSNAFGLFQGYYERFYMPSQSPSSISWIGSTQLALVFALGIPVGNAVDKGYFRWCFHGGTVIMIVALFASSYCQTWTTLWLVQGLITGIGMGCVFTSGLVALMSWFDERSIGLAMGLAAAGSCLGGVVYILISRSYLASDGFGPDMRVLSAITLATMIPPTLFMRERRYSRPLPNCASQSRWSLRLFADSAYLMAACGLFFSFLGLYFGFVYIITYAVDVLQLSDEAATNVLIYMLAVNLPGRLLPALVSDKVAEPLNTIICCTLLSSVVLCLWASFVYNESCLVVLACFYALTSGGIQSLYGPVTYSFCLQRADDDSGSPQIVLDRMGLKAGGIFSLIGVAVLVGTPIGGALIKLREDKHLDRPFLGAQIFACVALLLGGLFLLGSRCMRVGFGLRRA